MKKHFLSSTYRTTVWTTTTVLSQKLNVIVGVCSYALVLAFKSKLFARAFDCASSLFSDQLYKHTTPV